MGRRGITGTGDMVKRKRGIGKGEKRRKIIRESERSKKKGETKTSEDGKPS